MKILLTYRCKADQIGGVRTWMTSMHHGLRASGHECKAMILDGGRFRKIQLSESCPALAGGLADCIRLVRDRGFDVVHGATSDWDVGIATVRTVRPRPKLVLTHHGALYPCWSSANCDALVGCAAWAAADQQPWTDLPVRYVRNGIDTTRFYPSAVPPTGAPIVAWVARGADLEQKRLDKFAAAAPLLYRAGVRLWIADSDNRERVRPDLVRLLEPIAEVWERVPAGRIPDFYRAVAASGGCVLSTSAYEGLPLSLLEAVACGCPVVGPDVRGVNEVVGPESGGVLYPFDSPAEDVAELIIGMLGAPSDMEHRRQKAAEYGRECCSLDRMVREYVRAYESAPDRPSRRPVGRRPLPLTPAQVTEWISNRWSPANAQFQASARLMAEREWSLARRVAWASLTTCCTLYVRPRRLISLVRALCPKWSGMAPVALGPLEPTHEQ